MSSHLLSSIEDLDLSNSKLTDLSKLNGHVNLKSLNLSNNFLEYLGPSGIQTRHPATVPLTHNPWSQCNLLQQLNLSDNKIASLDQLMFLRPLKMLSSLDLRGNPITELPHYRHFVVNLYPFLNVLDQSPVTIEFVQESKIKCNTTQIDSLYQQINTLSSEIESMRTAAAKMAEKTPNKAEMRDSKEILELQSKIESLEKISNERNSDLIEARNRITELERNNHKNQVEIDKRLIETLTQLNIICPTPKSNNNSVSDEEIETLIIQKSLLEREIADLEKDKRSIAARVSELNNDLSVAKNALDQYENSITSNKNLQKIAEAELQQAREDLDKLTASTRSLKLEKDALTSQIQSMKIHANSQQAETDNNEIVSLRRQNAELLHEIKLLKEHYNSSVHTKQPEELKTPIIAESAVTSPNSINRKLKLLSSLKTRDSDNNVHEELLKARCELKSVLADLEYYKNLLNKTQRSLSVKNPSMYKKAGRETPSAKLQQFSSTPTPSIESYGNHTSYRAKTPHSLYKTSDDISISMIEPIYYD